MRETILITGAASGIGLATARRFSDSHLILVDRDPGDLAELFLNATIHVGDVTEESFWNGVDLTGLTRAVVNAGVSSSGAIAKLDFTEWRRVLSVNLDGAFLTLRAACARSRTAARFCSPPRPPASRPRRASPPMLPPRRR